MTPETIAAGLSEAQRIELRRHHTPTEGFPLTAGWYHAGVPVVAAALYRKSLLDRFKQGENPIHEPRREWFEYRLTPLGEAVRAVLGEGA